VTIAKGEIAVLITLENAGCARVTGSTARLMIVGSKKLTFEH
jgi:hypothetical protein